MANRFHNPRPQFMNATPVVYNAGVLRFYASGTSTPLSVYANSDLTSGSTSVTLNSAGRPSQDIFLSTLLYKVTLEDSLGNIIWSVDPYMTSDYTTTAKVTGYSGNPNGFVAGTASAGAIPADMVWDRTNRVLYICTTTGVAAAAVWTVANVSGLTNWTTAGRNVSPTAGVDFGYNTTLNRVEYWNATEWIAAGGKLPTVTRLITGGPLTYTSPTGAIHHRVRMAGGGGGGAAAVLNVAATSGTASSFKVNADAAAWTAAGGAFGAAAGGAGGAGGTGGTTGTTGTLINRSDGTAGGESPSAAGLVPGGNGGANTFGGGGVGIRGSTSGAGTSGKTNTGGGGAGGGQNGAVSGSGGGGGEYVEFWVSGMTTATYTVGAGGAAGTAGTVAGNTGAAGIIIIEEFYS